jgi:hypothetical protein
MPVQNIYKNAGSGVGTAGGGSSLNATSMWQADPDIAAQGAQQQKLFEMQNAAKNARFNQLLPMLGSYSGAGGGGVAQGQLASAPAARPNLGPAPVIHGGPIWSQQAINQNLNANNARIDQATAGQQMQQAGQMAGQGFGARSPLTRALAQMGNQSAMGQKADYARQFTQGAREANANFGLQSQQAQEKQYAQRQQEGLGYANIDTERYNTLQNALNQQLAAAQSGLNAKTSLQGSLANALMNLVG